MILGADIELMALLCYCPVSFHFMSVFHGHYITFRFLTSGQSESIAIASELNYISTNSSREISMWALGFHKVQVFSQDIGQTYAAPRNFSKAQAIRSLAFRLDLFWPNAANSFVRLGFSGRSWLILPRSSITDWLFPHLGPTCHGAYKSRCIKTFASFNVVIDVCCSHMTVNRFPFLGFLPSSLQSRAFEITKAQPGLHDAFLKHKTSLGTNTGSEEIKDCLMRWVIRSIGAETPPHSHPAAADSPQISQTEAECERHLGRHHPRLYNLARAREPIPRAYKPRD